MGIFAALSGSAKADAPTAIAVETLVKSTTSWDGNLLPAYPEGQPEVTVLRITIQPGARLPMHKHPSINAGVLLTGELQVNTIDGQTLLLKAGDALIELVDKLHYGANVGTTPATILVVYAGIESRPVTVKADEP